MIIHDATMSQNSSIWMVFYPFETSSIHLCLKNSDIQILLLTQHLHKVCINPQQIFFEKFQKSIKIDYLSYRLLSKNLTINRQ